MSGWITDRAPTKYDTSRNQDFYVWTIRNNEVTMWSYNDIEYGEPWMPIVRPEPYVKPKSWHIESNGDDMYLCHPLRGCMHLMNMVTSSRNHMQAAIRIAAIYEEVMP